MKKNIMMLIALSAACMQGMEKNNSNLWSITIENTKINLTKGNMFDTYIGGKNKVDFIVVEKYAKRRKNDLDGSACNYFLHNKDYNVCLEIEAPRVEINDVFEVFYERFKPEYKLYSAKLLSDCCYHSVDAVVEEAAKDLKRRYYDVLMQATQGKKEKIGKSVALPIVGIGSYKPHFKNNNDLENKAARCTISTIIEFIKDNPELLDCINIFVEADSEFNVYQMLLATFKIAPKTKNIYWEELSS